VLDDNPNFDVAISFLAKDEPIANDLYTELSRSLNVFYFPNKQENLAGTDGMESMRKPFLSDSRVMVVLYRDSWGKTRWTAIEETAIKDACFNGNWNRLFFVALDRTSPLPKWLPEYHVRYNWEDFGMDQIVGAIKARVVDNGGRPAPLTPRRRAEILNADEQYRFDKSRMGSPEGIARILRNVKQLFTEIEKQCDEVNSQGDLQIRYESDFREGQVHQSCMLTDNRVGMTLSWFQEYGNVLDDSGLIVHEYNSRILFHSEVSHLMLTTKPNRISETKYEPELSRAREYGWKKRGSSTEFLTSSGLAARCVVQFIDLVDRYSTGKVRRPSL